MGRRYRNGWWLEVKYHDEGLTQREIAEECGVSPSCVRDYMREYGIETREVSGETHGLYGQERDEETKRKISATLEDRDVSPETRRRMSEAHEGNRVPEEARRKISEKLSGRSKSEETRRKMSDARMGPDNPAWRGGTLGNYGAGWQRARETVRSRDGVCRQCGDDGTADRLEVHHIVPVRAFARAESADKIDAHDLGNLVLLCRSCHVQAERDGLGFDSTVENPIQED